MSVIKLDSDVERVFMVTVEAMCAIPELDEEDRGVPGYYIVTGQEDEETALDEFHCTIPIGCLDDFQITVVTAHDLAQVVSAGIDAAQGVVDNWSSGDLSGAVNVLEDWAVQAADYLPEAS